MDVGEIITKVMTSYGLVMSFMVIGAVMWVSYAISKLTKWRIHGSAIAIVLGLIFKTEITSFVNKTFEGLNSGF